jgi:hypothetical protein
MHPIPSYIALIVFVLATSCSGSQKARSVSSKKQGGFQIEAQDVYHKDETVEVKVYNPSHLDTLMLYKPRNLVVQKKQDGKWKQVRTLYCPCGASCPAPPEKVSVPPASGYTYRWNQKEEWCGEMSARGVPKMHSQFAGYGRYRMAVRYLGRENQQLQTRYELFSIKPEESQP